MEKMEDNSSQGEVIQVESNFNLIDDFKTRSTSILANLLMKPNTSDKKPEKSSFKPVNNTKGDESDGSLSEEGEIKDDVALDDDLKSIGINVWGHTQAKLEGQALKELQIFSEDNKKSTLKESTAGPSKSLGFDFNQYLNTQKELKKKQEYRKTLKPDTDYVKNTEELKSKKAVKRRSKSEDESEVPLKKSSKKNVPAVVYDPYECSYANTEDTNSSIVDDSSTSKEVPPKPKEKRAKKKLKRYTSEDGSSGSEYLPTDNSDDENGIFVSRKKIEKTKSDRDALRNKTIDDGCYENYKLRLEEYYQRLELEGEDENPDLPEYVNIRGLKVPSKNWENLYSYQKDGIKWLWHVHQTMGGGLLGDEMGLGKTVQVIVFLNAISYSQIKSKYGMYTGLGPTLIVAPTTVVHQWVQHFHEWAPEFRVAVLHSSGSFKGNKTKLIKDINKHKDILITTYSSVVKYENDLLNLNWHYVILDEGHKIRNPGTKVTIALKKLKALHRLMLTGSPMQNNLQELWCIFDFINPGMFGTLPAFLLHFADPITKGGYMNATPLQEATALSMATILKERITKCMLRRTKDVVQKYINLPEKTEQVLFCTLTDEQRRLYKDYLLSDHIQMVLGRSKNYQSQNQIRANMLVGITRLRKICNHPDLHSLDADTEYQNFIPHFNSAEIKQEELVYGDYKRSGKMLVVAALLKIWKSQKHRVLLFTQARGMIAIFQKFLKEYGYKYLKMDGSTNVNSRQSLIDTFNNDESIDVFLLTTKVGGLGLNLVGANRVIIYDPDWNPATDTQARERAWRIGQEKDVTIYRLLSAGTIEEKIYRRQIFKQLLANKVLVDPTAQKFFRTSDLYDIFSLQETPDESNMDSANIFRNQRISIQKKIDEKKSKKSPHDEDNKESVGIKLSDEKIKQMRELAHKIAKSVSSRVDKKIEEKKETLQENKDTGVETSSNEETLSVKEETVVQDTSIKQIKKEPDKVNDTEEQKASDISSKWDAELKKVDSKYEEQASTSREKRASSKESRREEKLKKKSKDPTKKDKTKVDLSGKIDGEKVEGLLKIEIKKLSKDEKEKQQVNQDSYILEKLFSSNGVQIALQHDSIFKTSSGKRKGVSVDYEAQLKADLALKALEDSNRR